MKLKIYMKSGNVITVGDVKTVDIKYDNENITFINIDYTKEKSRGLMLGSLCLQQIEAIETI